MYLPLRVIISPTKACYRLQNRYRKMMVQIRYSKVQVVTSRRSPWMLCCYDDTMAERIAVRYLRRPYLVLRWFREQYEKLSVNQTKGLEALMSMNVG